MPLRGNDIGIVTLQTLRGHGQRLQNYATTLVCRSEGYEAHNLILEEDTAARVINSAKELIKRAIKYQNVEYSPERTAAFERFNNLMSFRKTRWREASSVASEFDWIITGSDQVWNPAWLDRKHAEWYFLKFANSCQRIALAPSIGLNSLDEQQSAFLRSGVEGFERLSVREKRGAELIKEVSDRDAVVLPDPTLVVFTEDWLQVADYSLVPSTPYTLAYVLGDIGDEYRRAINTVASAFGDLPVITLSDKSRSGEPPAGPSEFIGLIRNATNVVTDSFHAAVFSMLMNTPLIIIKRDDRNPGMFSRLESLADTYGLRKNIYGDNSFDIRLAGDYSYASTVIPVERNRFLNYFRGCLHD